MSYPPNPPEGSYPPPGPYPTIPQQQPAPEEQPPSPPFATGQPTAVVPAAGYPQQTAPQPPAYQPGSAAIPSYPPPAPAYPQPGYGESYPPGLAPTAMHPTVSGPPSVDPLSGPPGYGPPVSGYPAMSGVPDYGQAPPKRGRGAMITFAILTVLFFLASAVLTGLYVTKSGAYDKKVSDLKARDTTISALNTQVADLTRKAKTAQDALDAANQKQTGTQNQLDEVTKEKQVIGNCLTLLSEAIVAANSGDAATAKSKADAAQAPCDEAQKYLN